MKAFEGGLFVLFPVFSHFSVPSTFPTLSMHDIESQKKSKTTDTRHQQAGCVAGKGSSGRCPRASLLLPGPRPRWVSPYLSPPSLLSFPGALLTEEGSLGCPSFTAGDS